MTAIQRNMHNVTDRIVSKRRQTQKGTHGMSSLYEVQNHQKINL